MTEGKTTSVHAEKAPDTLGHLEELRSPRPTVDTPRRQVAHQKYDSRRQAHAVGASTDHAPHIHASVGCFQLPHVSDPRGPEFTPQAETLLLGWPRIVRARAAAQNDLVAILPEFGPQRSQPADHGMCHQLADPWKVNVWVRDRLRFALSACF